MSKKQLPSSPTINWKATSVDNHLTELREREREIVNAILAAEATGSPLSEPPADEVARRAHVMMNGSAPKLPVTQAVSDLRIDREAVSKAIRHLETVQGMERDAKLRQLTAELGDEWRELLREVAATLCRLRWLNGLRSEFKRQVPGVRLPVDQFALFGDGTHPSNEADAFFTALKRAGIVTAGELKTWTERKS
jgi:hypothetical protein